MSDIEFSPPKHRDNLPLHIDCDLPFKDRDNPKCVNSLCNLIHTRLKLLENEILTQHKVWEYIQREVDEVKSLIEDCTSTCDSSSLSGHENDSEVVDSALESHKTCNSLLWDKLKQTEENVEEKKSLMQILSSDISKLKSSKKKCKRRFEKANSNIDLILEVTNGLHVLKCEECKFCSEHIDFREGLLTSVIELIHFSEKKYNACLEENKTLKSCLQKIYMKTKRCLLHSQIYVRNTQQQYLAYETDNSSFCTDSIYSSFEEFCQHFQSLQEELMQLKHILLAAEENHLDEVFQSSHSSDCKCYSYSRKGKSYVENDYGKNETKLSNEKNFCYYEKKVKTLNSNNEPENSDPEPVFDENHMFSSMANNADKQQLEALRSHIFEAVKVIRDVEVVENDDQNLINMVASLAEECSALRQEVSYLRNVRQEKKRSWNKLQCFIMDAERKLKGSNRNIPELRDVIRDLGQLIATSESSSLDETVLYMYSNQLEWIEKSSMGCESPSYQVVLCDGTETESHIISPIFENNTESATASTQTYCDFYLENEQRQCFIEKPMCDIAIQTDNYLNICTVENFHSFDNPFQEISREIYVVPEVLEEADQNFSSIEDSSIQPVNSIGNVSDDHMTISEIEMDCLYQNQDIFFDNESNCMSQTQMSTSILPLSGSFPVKVSFSTHDNFGPILIQKTKSEPFFEMSDISFVFPNSLFHPQPNGRLSDRFQYLSSPLVLNSSANMKHFCNSMFHNMLKNYIKSIEICDTKNNLSCIVFKSKDFPSSFVSFDKSRKYLPYELTDSSYVQENSLVMNNEVGGITDQNSYVCDNVSAASVVVDFSMLSSIANEELLPNDDKCDRANENSVSTSFFETQLYDNTSDYPNSTNICEENDMECENIDENDFTLDKAETFVQEKPAPACREGTFIIDSGEKFVLNNSEAHEKCLYHSVILTALVSNDTQNSEKSYILYEIDSSTKNSTMFLQNVNPFLVSNFHTQQPSGQHFILCEAIANEENLKSQAIASNVSCHIVFFKTNFKEENSSSEKHVDNISETYPLLPQYLPPENCNFDNFDNFSLAQSCEIYMCNIENSNVESDPENIAFTPKNYFKFKELFPVNQSNNLLSEEKVLCQAVFKQNLAPNFSKSYEENCDMNLNVTKNICEKDLSEITSQLDLDTRTFPDYAEKEIQTDEVSELHLKENYIPLEKFSDEFQEHLGANAEFEEHISFEQKQNMFGSERQKENLLIYNHSSQEQAIRETSLLDEIEALKDNLNQQNAVLMRLKEDLEDSHFQLAEKEELLVILQLEHGRLNAMLTENDVREIDEKECQTDVSPSKHCEELEKEILILRQKNLEHYEKIVHQNHTIQSVKSQLCATISHLKHLKDAATKQLKKQKHHVIKSAKLKQHLHDTKTELEKKCQELDKKNELLSDQEFHLQEMRIRLDSTIEELRQKSSTSDVNSTSYERLDCGCQTDAIKISSFEESNNMCQQSKHDMTLKKHSEELMALHAKFRHLETALSNKKEHKALSDEIVMKSNDDVQSPANFKDGNIWKLLTISEQSYLSLLNKLSEALQLSDLKGSSALMHSSWLSCDALADARRHDHKKILQSLEKMKRSIRYLQESLNLQNKRQNADNTPTDEKKSSFVCHSEEMHFQYLCEVLQRAQESLAKDYSQKRSSSRTVVTAGSGRMSRHAGSRERRIPLELKNGKILAVLDDKFNQQELLPNKFDYSKIEYKSGNSKTKTPS